MVEFIVDPFILATTGRVVGIAEFKSNQGVSMKNKEEPQQNIQKGSLPGYLNIPKKECNKCHQVKIMDEFNKNQNCKDGYEGQCKACKYQHYKDKKASKKQAKKVIPEKKQKPSTAMPMKADPFTEYVLPEPTIQDEKTGDQALAASLDEIGAAMIDTKTAVDQKIMEENHKSMENRESVHTEKWSYDEPVVRKDPDKILTIDFRNYPDIYQAIEDIALDEFRTLEMQVLFWLRSHLSSSGDSRYRGKMYQQG